MHHLLVRRAREPVPARPRALLAKAGAVWMWPGVALTEWRGALCVSIDAAVARFWITRLYGPEAAAAPVEHALAIAARRLTEGDESGAQKAIDGMGLARVPPDGAALIRAVANRLGVVAPGLPVADGPRLWRAQDIDAHVALLRDYAPAASLLAKAGGWDESKHPRVPAGSAEGGQFTSGGGGAGDEADSPQLPAAPKIPASDPLTEKLRNAFIKQAARWASRALAGAAFGAAGEFLAALEAAAETAQWLYDKYPYLKAYLDAPRSLDELQRDVGKAEAGYQVHHIVEQAGAARDGFTRDEIESPENLVRIPTLKHWEITAWYMTPNKNFEGRSPRVYLIDKSWEERRKTGIDALTRFKVLKR